MGRNIKNQDFKEVEFSRLSISTPEEFAEAVKNLVPQFLRSTCQPVQS